MDKIYIEKMEFFAFHGVMEEEKKLGQKFIIDLVIEADLKNAGKTDNLEKTVNYALVYEKVKELTINNRYDLIEALAENIAEKILEDKMIKKIKVKVNKPSAPVQGIFSNIAVEIERDAEV